MSYPLSKYLLILSTISFEYLEGKYIYSQTNGSGDNQQDFTQDLNDIINGQKK